MKKMEILGKNSNAIDKRIKRIEAALPQITIKDGIPTPIWDNEGTLINNMQQFNVPGISIAVINNFELEWLKCYGIKNNTTKELVRLNTLFEGGSTAKSITALALILFCERYGIKLNQPVNDRLKGWKIPKNQYTEKTEINLIHLLTHTAGINRPESMFGFEKNSKPTIEQVLKGELPAKNDPVEVLFEPGTKHQYSNMGYLIIQKYLEDISGLSFPKLMKKIVFDKLSMKDSQFGFENEKDKEKVIVPHDQDGKVCESGIHPTALAMGGLLSTPRDLSKFVIEIMNAYNDNKTKFLLPEIARRMLKTETELDPSYLFGFTGQGLGMFLIKNNDDLFFTHPGTNMPGATCMMIGNVKSGKGAVIMANSITGELVNAQILFSIIREYNWYLWGQ